MIFNIFEYFYLFFCTADIAKSYIVFEVSPWDLETDLTAMEKAIRTIESDGLVWGQGKPYRMKNY